MGRTGVKPYQGVNLHWRCDLPIMASAMRRCFSLAAALLTLAVALPLDAPGDARLKPGEVWLEIPELQTKVEPNGFVVLPVRPISYLELHIAKIAPCGPSYTSRTFSRYLS